MSTLTIRGLDSKTEKLLKRKAAEEGASMNGFVIKVIRQALGIEKKRRTYDDLDRLAGTWSEKDFKEFEKNTSDFEAIDHEMWR